MTTKAAFSPEEWTSVLEGPPSAGMIVVTAASGGMFRETVAMSKAYVEARAVHGQSELLDEIVAAKPKMDTPGTAPAKSSKTPGCSTCVPRWRCWRARRHPMRSTSTGASFSLLPTRSRPHTGRRARR